MEKTPLPFAATMEEVCRRLKAARKAIGPNAKKFAESAGITTTAWANYEAAQRMPNVADMMRLSLRYGLPLDFIYLGKIDRVPNDLVERLEAQLIEERQSEPVSLGEAKLARNSSTGKIAARPKGDKRA